MYEPTKLQSITGKAGNLLLQLLLMLGLTLLPGPATGRACSVFAEGAAKDSKWVIGKNFDWHDGGGLQVINPRGAKRSAFNPKNDTEWVAKLGSVTLTALGPGLPVSGMNEAGLVLETLVDNSYYGPMGETDRLLSLEWGQYILDNFTSTGEVIRFARKTGFDQVIVALHFFICDLKKRCVVIESNPDGSTKILSGANLPATRLANRNYQSDLKTARIMSMASNIPGVSSLIPGYFSPNRFRKLGAATEGRSFHRPEQVFASLNRSFIPGLIQWQLAWFPEQSKLYWRSIEGKKPQPVQTVDLTTLSLDCKQQVLVRKTTSRFERDFRAYNKLDARGVSGRLGSSMMIRTGKTFPEFLKRVEAYTLSHSCRQP